MAVGAESITTDLKSKLVSSYYGLILWMLSIGTAGDEDECYPRLDAKYPDLAIYSRRRPGMEPAVSAVLAEVFSRLTARGDFGD
jgi:hypothetical protein